MKTKKVFALILSAILMLSLLPTEAFAAIQNQSLTNERIKNLSGYALGTGYYYLEENIALDASLVIPNGAAVNLDLRGHTLSTTAQASVIKLEENASLTVNDSTADNTDSYGGTITNNLVATGYVTEEFQGGGVYVSKGAEFTLNAGKITKCGALRGRRNLCSFGRKGGYDGRNGISVFSFKGERGWRSIYSQRSRI